MRPVTIAFRGNFRPDHSTETHVSKTMEAMGHRVVRIQEDEVPWAKVPEIVHHEAADLFWWTCTWHEDLAGGHAALGALRAAQVPSITHHLDYYIGLDREKLIPDDPFWRADYVFTADGGHQEQFAAYGINHHWIRPGVYAPECVIGQTRKEYQCDVAFIGSYNVYHAEWRPYRQRLVDGLRGRYGKRYKHYAGGLGPVVRGQDLNDAIASAKVIVGDSLCQGFTHPFYWSDRVYETLGRGGFMIHPRIAGMEDELYDGVHLRYYTYDDFDQLFALIDHYVEHDDERLRIRDAGHMRVKEVATYTSRLKEIFAVVCASDTRFLGVRELIDVRERSDDAAIVDEVWDAEVYRVRDLVEPGETVIDIGANIGAFSLWAADQLQCNVLAIEPEPGNFAKLEANIASAMHLLDRKITTEHAALGARAGTTTVKGAGGSAHTSSDLYGTPVAMKPLAWALELAGTEQVALVKIDTEGAEYAIIEGAAGEDLQRVRSFVIEFHGPGLTGGRVNGDQLGPLVAKLAETHKIEVIGRPSAGGTVYARRYEA